ncbi:MAG: exo-alpha-sialidase [Acidobacteria bacterium]|nr:exo-alpha-sialidase [Acidobacteriota bacterium]
MRVKARLILVVPVALASVACNWLRWNPPDPATWSIDIRPVIAPASSTSSEPQLTASNGRVILTWVDRTASNSVLKFAEHTGGGWSAPVTVAQGSDWFLSYADPPAVMRLSNGTLVAQWLQQTDPRVEAMDLKLSYSRDQGKTWASPFTPHHDGTMTQHAFASMFEMPGSTLGLVWLDGRESFAETDDPAGGSMTMRYAAFDDTWKQTADAAVDHKVCECCSTSAAVTPDGILTAFRDRADGEIRNIAVTRLENGTWTTPAAVHDDGWKTYACPVNGPALSTRGRQAVVAWFNAANDEGHSFVAFSVDAGRTWGSPIRLDDALSVGRVDVELLDDGAAVATWIEYAGGRSEVRTRLVTPNGLRSKAIPVARVGQDAAAGLPRLARQNNELIFAWTESGSPDASGETPLRVKTAVASLP